MVISARRPAAATACFFATPGSCRILNCWSTGCSALLLGSNTRDDNTSLIIDLTNPDLYAEQRLVLPKDTVHIVRTIFVYRNSLYQRIGLRNYANRPISLTLSLVFDNDFADVFEVRGLRRPRRGKIERLVAGRARTLLTYYGLDGKLRQTDMTLTHSRASCSRRRQPIDFRSPRGRRDHCSVA